MVRLRNIVLSLLVGAGSLLSAACASRIVPNDDSGTCSPVGSVPEDISGLESGLIVAHTTLFACTCGQRSVAGASEARSLRGADEARRVGSGGEARHLGGSAEDRSLSAVDERRDAGATTEERQIAGTDEERQAGGRSEARPLLGAGEERRLAGSDENRLIAGDSEDRLIGGVDQPLACYPADGCSGFVVSGRGPLQMTHRGGLMNLEDRCVPW